MKLVLDTNILVSEALRERGRNLIRHRALELYPTEHAWGETRYETVLRVEAIARQRGASDEVREGLLRASRELIESNISIEPASSYSHIEMEARRGIPQQSSPQW